MRSRGSGPKGFPAFRERKGTLPEGVIVGGWGYVIAGYAFAAAVLALYGASLFWRLRALRSLDGDAKAPKPR